jgi:hypothetical protein
MFIFIIYEILSSSYIVQDFNDYINVHFYLYEI